MSALLDELIEVNASYQESEGPDPRQRQKRMSEHEASEQMTDGEQILRRLFFSPVGTQSLDHLLSCWRPGKGHGWTDDRVIKTLEKLIDAGLVTSSQALFGLEYKLTPLAHRHYSVNGRKRELDRGD